MRPWLWLVVAACSPSGTDAPAVQHRDELRRSIDVPVRGGSIAIRGVEVTPGANHALVLGYRVEASDKTLEVPAEITCRVHGFNLVYPAAASGKVSGPRLTAAWRPDPFSDDPEICQIDFWQRDVVAASACYRAGELSAGACPDGSFPLHAQAPLETDLAGHFAVDLVHATFEVRGGAAVVNGIFSKLERLPGGDRVVSAIRCDDPAGAITGEGALPLVPLERMAVGASVFGPAPILLERAPADGAHCVFRLLARSPTGAAKDEELAKYCVTAGTPAVLTCTL